MLSHTEKGRSEKARIRDNNERQAEKIDVFFAHSGERCRSDFRWICSWAYRVEFFVPPRRRANKVFDALHLYGTTDFVCFPLIFNDDELCNGIIGNSVCAAAKKKMPRELHNQIQRVIMAPDDLRILIDEHYISATREGNRGGNLFNIPDMRESSKVEIASFGSEMIFKLRRGRAHNRAMFKEPRAISPSARDDHIYTSDNGGWL